VIPKMAFSHAELMSEKSGLPFETVIESKLFQNYGKKMLGEMVHSWRSSLGNRRNNSAHCS
jgi:hypothetical protein